MNYENRSFRLVSAASALWLAIAGATCAEQVTSEEFQFAAEKPGGEDWLMLQNGTTGDESRSYKLVFFNLVDKRAMTLLVMPLSDAVLKSAKGIDITEPDKDMKKGFETSFFAVDKKVSSEPCKLSGLNGLRCVGLKKLPNGDERYSVGILVVYKKRSYLVGGLCREPWPKDKELDTFVDSLTIGPKKAKSRFRQSRLLNSKPGRCGIEWSFWREQ